MQNEAEERQCKMRSGLHRHRRLASERCPHTRAEIPADDGSDRLGFACLSGWWLRSSPWPTNRGRHQPPPPPPNPTKLPVGTDRAVLVTHWHSGSSWRAPVGRKARATMRLDSVSAFTGRVVAQSVTCRAISLTAR